MSAKEWPACELCGNTKAVPGKFFGEVDCPACRERPRARSSLWTLEDYRYEVFWWIGVGSFLWFIVAFFYDFEETQQSLIVTLFGMAAFRLGMSRGEDKTADTYVEHLQRMHETANRRRDRLLGELERTIPNWHDLSSAEKVAKWREWTGDPNF
jgi:hypothetical protein